MFLLTSCMTLLPSDPTLVGVWKAEDGDFTYTRSYTEDGIYVLEKESDTFHFHEFGSYEADEDSLYMDGYGTHAYTLEGKTLVVDDLVYRKVSGKAVNNTSHINGVWQNDRYIIGFATDGLVISQGAYMNMKEYTLEDDHIRINGNSTQFVVINNNLYIRRFDFLKNGNTIRLSRVSSGGKNNTSLSILCDGSPWFYQDTSASDLTGTLYTFSYNGRYQGTNYRNGVPGSATSGSYTLDGNRIRLSSGGVLVFAYIDSTPFGYT